MGSEDESDSSRPEHDNYLDSNAQTNKRTVFRIFGVEMLAPEGLKNAGSILFLLVAINFFLLFFLKNLLNN